MRLRPDQVAVLGPGDPVDEHLQLPPRVLEHRVVVRTRAGLSPPQGVGDAELDPPLLDRGELQAWREIYRLAARPGEEAAALRRRIIRLCQTVPLSFPHLFLAAVGALGEELEPYPEIPEPVDDVA